MKWTGEIAEMAAALLRYFPWRGSTFASRFVQRYLKQGESRIASYPEGYRMELDTRDFWQRIIYTAAYERRERWYIKELLRPGEVFFDLGAHLGYYTCLAAARVAPGGAAHAFEPNPEMAEILKRQAALNPNLGIQVHELGVSDRDTERELHIPPNNDFFWMRGYASLTADADPRIAAASKVKVSCVSLDGFIESRGIRAVRLAKIDIEREEGPALRGARRSLQSGALESMAIEVTDETKGEVAEEIDRYGFEVIHDLRFFRPMKRFADLEPIGKHLTTANVLCLRGECAKRWRALGARRWLV